MSKIITNLFRNIKFNTNNSTNTNTHIERQIGRWCIPKTPGYFQTATLIMDRSNEDHCGTCGDSLLTNKNTTINIQNSIQNNIELEKLSKEEIYYYPYTM
jgi:phosphopentomutase